ncbi:hypothetical protein EDB85DRAFT_2048335, partial [Lactarius pseudohatsudake]
MGLGLELTSPDHSATWTFLHTRRLYQGPGLPLTRELPPRPARSYNLPLLPLSPTLLPLQDDGLHTWPAPECLVVGERQDFGAGPRPRYAGR